MPIPLLLYHTGNMSMKNRIPMKKIQFLHNVSNLPPGTLVRDVFVKQCQHNIGLVAEFSPVLEGLELHDIQSYNKFTMKKTLKMTIRQQNKSELLEMSKGYKKISPDFLSENAFGVHNYFKTLTVSQARLRLKLAAQMTPRVATCFPSDKSINFQCVACRASRRPVGPDI